MDNILYDLWKASLEHLGVSSTILIVLIILLARCMKKHIFPIIGQAILMQNGRQELCDMRWTLITDDHKQELEIINKKAPLKVIAAYRSDKFKKSYDGDVLFYYLVKTVKHGYPHGYIGDEYVSNLGFSCDNWDIYLCCVSCSSSRWEIIPSVGSLDGDKDEIDKKMMVKELFEKIASKSRQQQ